MLVFAASDKGGTGRSVTSSNVVYRSALDGNDVCYLDFDFGSPTVGAIFQITSVARGTKDGGLHNYLLGRKPEAQRLDVWNTSERTILRDRPARAGRLLLYPGDAGMGEFMAEHRDSIIDACVRLFLRLEEEFELTLVDLSAGRSFATELVLAATARPELQNVKQRWLVFHRWTSQHVVAASSLVYGAGGIRETAKKYNHDPAKMTAGLRFVRTAVINPDSTHTEGLTPAQDAWLKRTHQDLLELAGANQVGRNVLLGEIPLDPVLQWHEQLISDDDVLASGIARQATADAFAELALSLMDDSRWRES
ncbi:MULTISPECIES: SCO2523 family variant P-loop protein [Dactylosporangium]|uniref:DNA-binding protein n=2 Tax=Dactylosporangium TaxID=35753 RepID=A0A9W6KMH5_9ACTN|nr:MULTISPECIES: SCO2523 family variant P-loop protein [Dactylosporangium]UAB97687.1 ParA family protein [Dactylosporangium vinaceum]UWZ45931.1 ParA family protein [Dactylosporangium matsuzakiense]GLL02900.1 DNA-binding protein [Dactylosporangium matsuzakiense]